MPRRLLFLGTCHFWQPKWDYLGLDEYLHRNGLIIFWSSGQEL